METTENVPQIFNFNGQEVRTLLDSDENILFNANDICAFLEFSNPRTALANFVRPWLAKNARFANNALWDLDYTKAKRLLK